MKELDPAARLKVAESYGRLPLSFEPNKGQVDSEVKFLSRGSGYNLFLTGKGATFVFTKRERAAGSAADPCDPIPFRDGLRHEDDKVTRSVVRMQLEGSNPSPKAAGLERLPGNVNYFIGNDPKKWHTDIPTYGKVEMKNVYKGVDLVYYGNQRQLEYDFVVRPGADPSAIRMAFHGADRIETDDAGNLVIAAATGTMSLRKPLVYQEVAGRRIEIAGGYSLEGNEVAFRLDRYDRAKRLVIDPIFVYSTYLGGSGLDIPQGIKIDTAGNAYVAGYTESIDFPTTAGSYLPTKPAPLDSGFIAKLNPTGTALVFSTYLGGTAGSGTVIFAVDIDASGAAYVTGRNYSEDYPTTPNAFDRTKKPIFVTKLSSFGNQLAYSTFIGGAEADTGAAIAVDTGGAAHITGYTLAGTVPTTPGAIVSSGSPIDGTYRVFVTKLNASGTALLYSTYLGGTSSTSGLGIAVRAGQAYVVGYSFADFPTTPGAFQTTRGGGTDGFVSKLNSAGTSFDYSTYLGASSTDVASGIAVDVAGNAYVTGNAGPGFPTTPGAFRDPDPNSFVAKLDPTGSQLVYSALIRSGVEPSIAIDDLGSSHVIAPGDIVGAFLTKLTPDGSGLSFATRLGGGGTGRFGTGAGVTVDPSGAIFAAVLTSRTDLPITPGAFQDNYGGGINDSFIVKIRPPAAVSASGVAPPSGPSLGGTSVTISGSGFQAGATVSFGGSALTGINVTDTTITGLTSAHVAGAVDVVVTNPDTGSATLAGGFTYTCGATAPTATVSGSTAICPGVTATLSVALTGAGPWNLVWSDGFNQDGVASSPATRSVAPSATTTYTVTTVTDQNCTGAGSGSAVITANPAPSAAISAPVALCIGSTAQASVPDAGSGAVYAWTITGGTITSGADTRTVQFNADQLGTLALSVSVTKGCTTTGSQQVLVGDPPTATLLETTSLTLTVNLTGFAPWRLVWSDGYVQSGITTSPATRFVEPFITTTYTLTSVGDATGCPGTVSGSATITVAPIVMIPSAVSMPIGYDKTVLIFLATPVATTTTMALSNSDPTVVSAPQTLTIPAGQRTVSFTLRGLKAGGPVSLSATLPGVGTATCTATVTVPIVILTRTDLSIPLGGRFALPAFLSAFPASDTTLEITSSNTSIIQIEGPTSKTIKVGNNHDTFLLHAVGVGGPVVVTISSPQLGPGATATVLVSVPSVGQPCSGSATALCLGASRFSVQVAWQSYFDGSSGVGTAVPLTGDSGYFWFFNDQNVELIVKVLDGRAVNNSFWVLYGALTDVSYTVTVTDTVTGQSKTYYNPAHTLASVADVTAFPGVGRPAVRVGGELGRLASLAPRDVSRSAPAARTSASPSSSRSPLATCTSGPNDLCLNAARFSVSVSWRNYNNDETGAGQAVALTGDSGYFWFFSSENVELVVKVLDGTATNGKFWVLYGALSDVEYTITIIDTSTGATKTYFNPAHTLASQADITAF